MKARLSVLTGLLCAISLVATACGLGAASKPSTPSEAGQRFMKALVDGNSNSARGMMSAQIASKMSQNLDRISSGLKGCSSSKIEITSMGTNMDTQAMNAALVPACGNYNDVWGAMSSGQPIPKEYSNRKISNCILGIGKVNDEWKVVSPPQCGPAF